jgi:hypothetical protein
MQTPLQSLVLFLLSHFHFAEMFSEIPAFAAHICNLLGQSPFANDSCRDVGTTGAAGLSAVHVGDCLTRAAR